MKFRRESSEQGPLINITSLIDVVFILLIFFAVTTSFISTSSIKVDLPKAKGEAVEQKKNIRVSINNNGTIYIDGSMVSDAELSARFDIMKKSNPDALVVIEADEKALHGKVVFVIDKARSSDFTRFAIATEEEK